jgi:hypothetical protein
VARKPTKSANEAAMAELEAEAATVSESAPKASLEAVRAMGVQAAELQRRIVKGEELLAKLKTERYTLLNEQMPSMMDDLKVKQIEVDDFLMKVEPYYKAAIKKDDPPEQREAAFKWLEKNEGGDIIKYAVEIEFPTESQDQALELFNDLKRRFGNRKDVNVTMQKDVPWSRLTSWLRHLVESPTDKKRKRPAIPLDLLNATLGRIVKIKSTAED